MSWLLGWLGGGREGKAGSGDSTVCVCASVWVRCESMYTYTHVCGSVSTDVNNTIESNPIDQPVSTSPNHADSHTFVKADEEAASALHRQHVRQRSFLGASGAFILLASVDVVCFSVRSGLPPTPTHPPAALPPKQPPPTHPMPITYIMTWQQRCPPAT